MFTMVHSPVIGEFVYVRPFQFNIMVVIRIVIGTANKPEAIVNGSAEVVTIGFEVGQC